MAKEFHQVPGFDFHDTFSLIIKLTTTFLNGFLKENIYMEQPLGFVSPFHPNRVYKLHRALYGLKQPPQAWFERLPSKLLSLALLQK